MSIWVGPKATWEEKKKWGMASVHRDEEEGRQTNERTWDEMRKWNHGAMGADSVKWYPRSYSMHRT